MSERLHFGSDEDGVAFRLWTDAKNPGAPAEIHIYVDDSEHQTNSICACATLKLEDAKRLRDWLDAALQEHTK